jgi:hypothetical protein
MQTDSPVLTSAPVIESKREKIEELIQEVRRCPGCGRPMLFAPHLKCEDCNAEVSLKWQLYKKGSSYYAECLTLDLLSMGATPDEAVRRLQVAIYSYVTTVLSSSESSEGLIPRPAPFSSWVRYYFSNALYAVKCRFRRKRSSARPAVIWSVPVSLEEEGYGLVAHGH